MLQQAETAAMLKKQTNTESNEDDKDTIRLIVDTPYMVTTQEMEDHDFPFAFIEAFVSRGRCDIYPCCTCMIRTVVASRTKISSQQTPTDAEQSLGKSHSSMTWTGDHKYGKLKRTAKRNIILDVGALLDNICRLCPDKRTKGTRLKWTK